MTEALAILGSTGSIGRRTVEAARLLGLGVTALAAHSNITLLEAQARQLRPELAAVFDEEAAAVLRDRLADTDIRVCSGLSGLTEAAVATGADTVLTAVSGAVGLIPTLAAIEEGKRIALANKETLVCAGDIVTTRAKFRGADIIPVDSEHSAIFQCLEGLRNREHSVPSGDLNEKLTDGRCHTPAAGLRKILLTASGGPFRGMTLSETEHVTPQQALSHPNWSMGAKISIDSATMMNKGLEFIEAMHLFNVPPQSIEILVHPQSIVHSMVEFCDGSVIAQLGTADMLLPITYALTYPERRDTGVPAPDFPAIGALSFEQPDYDNLPCLRTALTCAKRGGTAPAVMNAANEIAVGCFLEGRIPFHGIHECIECALDSIDITDAADLETVLAADSAARQVVRSRLDSHRT